MKFIPSGTACKDDMFPKLLLQKMIDVRITMYELQRTIYLPN